MLHRSLPIALVLMLSASACGPTTDNTTPKQDTLVVSGNDASELTTSIYQMPTPNELFLLVREMAGDGQKRMMSPALNVDRYVSLSKRALNFGVYATDMVYASSFKLTSEVVRYYLTCKKLGDDLGLSTAFSDQDFARLERNLAHGDSMDVISNEAYQKVYQRMQDDKMGPTLALVLAGGWVESMHLVTRQVIDFHPGDPLILRLAEQKASLEHLIDMMQGFKEDPNVAPVLEKLMAMRNIYDSLNIRRSKHVGVSSSGRMVLGDDITVNMNAEEFKELDSAVEALRASIISPEDTEKTAK